MTCMKQKFCIYEKYCQRHIGQNFDSCILFSRNSKPMTNEEWFCQLSTKEKAEIIAQLSSYGGNVEAILEWLKQPHREENVK